VTVSDTLSVCAKPLSPSQLKRRVPLALATVKNEMNGFAATAGNSSALNTSTSS
jgi:hypothetical protein